MSLERAKINCERCYGLAKDVINSEMPSSKSVNDIKKFLYPNKDVYVARNDAMVALENLKGSLVHNDDVNAKPELIFVSGLLKKCADCYYNAPWLVNAFYSRNKG